MKTATTIGEVFHANASVRPEKIAFEMADGRRRTFLELDRRVSRLVSALYASGHEPGDRVAILSKNSIEYFEAYGVSSGGLIPVPLNWRLSPRELSTILADCRPRTVIYNASFREIAEITGHAERDVETLIRTHYLAGEGVIERLEAANKTGTSL